MPVPITVKDTPPELMEEAVEAGRREVLQYIAYSVGTRPKAVTVTYDKDAEEFVVDIDKGKPRIERLRRITGYLSNLNNFNGGKKAEEKDRVKHYKVPKEFQN